MKATKAYIASLGTTGVLLGASLLMLAVVSAVVAFDAWPGGKVDNRVRTLVLDEHAPSIRVSANSAAPSATPRSARAGTPTAATAPRLTPTAGGVAAPNLGAGVRVPSATVPAPAPASDPTKALQPVQDTTTPIFDSISNPGSTAGQVADGASSVTDQVGVSVGRVSPDLGSAVTTAGQAASDVVRQAPLPDHVIPGH